jgi:hypothetical protein
MIRADSSRSIVRRLEIFGLCPIAIALTAASAITWRTIDRTSRPLRPAESTPNREVDPPPVREVRPCPMAEDTATEGVELDTFVPEVPCGFDQVRPPRPLALPSLRPVVSGLPPAEPPASTVRRVRIGDERGRSWVAQCYGGGDSRVVLLPDGSLGWPNAMIDTEEPFRPLDADSMIRELSDGPYRHFQTTRTEHYVIFFTSSPEFAQQSAALLEGLYRGLIRTFQARGVDVREAGFPLVAVIYRNESEFREHKEVDPDVQAIYEVVSNRIFFYETRHNEPESPALTSMRKPQTAAHEGTHQVLQNIGVQPRLASWPVWLVEGLAEYFAPAVTLKGEWAGCGRSNPLHLATLREMEDGPAHSPRTTRFVGQRIVDALDRQAIRDLLARSNLAPTDYATSWALVHYLATKRSREFDDYLKGLSQQSPLARISEDAHYERFREAFGEDLTDLGRQVVRHAMNQRCGESLPFLAVTFEQVIDDEQVRRGTIVSQSPWIVQQWLEGMMVGGTFPPVVVPMSFPTRSSAFQAVEQWHNRR